MINDLQKYCIGGHFLFPTDSVNTGSLFMEVSVSAHSYASEFI